MDFGTLSARTILVDAFDGTVAGEETFSYPHGIMDDELTGGRPLPPFFALQDPRDYLDALGCVRELLKKTGTAPEEVAGMGIDFTSCTMLPVAADGTPLAFLPEFREEPHAFVKAWKHHAAQPEADTINRVAAERGETWIRDYGGKASSEWLLPKILETLHHAPAVFERAARFTEAADWISFVLTGVETRSPAFAGYKAFWNAETGYPSDAFFEAVDPRLRGIIGTKLQEAVSAPDGIAGTLNERGAALTGLAEGTVLALPMIDAHAVLPALRATEEGDLALILGTSACQIANAAEKKTVEGICGVVKDAVIPGIYTYEAGQPAVGDAFDWFLENRCPEAYRREAETRKISVRDVLREKAARLMPGESGLIALDWLNGNRSVLNDANLSGVMAGLTLATKPEDEYRAWIEAAAFGTRRILEQFERSGVAVCRIVAAGGIARKDPLVMQIYADVLGREIGIAASDQTGALGSAIYGAVAAGLYPTVREASAAMTEAPALCYKPVEKNSAVYDRLYEEYRTLYDWFGRNGISERLGALRKR